MRLGNAYDVRLGCLGPAEHFTSRAEGSLFHFVCGGGRSQLRVAELPRQVLLDFVAERRSDRWLDLLLGT